MLYANEEIFNINYNSDSDRPEAKRLKEKKKLSNFINTHKLMTSIMALFIMFSAINCLLIYSFIELLKNI